MTASAATIREIRNSSRRLSRALMEEPIVLASAQWTPSCTAARHMPGAGFTALRRGRDEPSSRLVMQMGSRRG